MKGTDGRIYKADYGSQHQTSVYETQEVFDVLPSTIGLPVINVQDEKYNKNTLSTKQSVVSFKGRPTSAKQYQIVNLQIIQNIKADTGSMQQSFVSQKGGSIKKY